MFMRGEFSTRHSHANHGLQYMYLQQATMCAMQSILNNTQDAFTYICSRRCAPGLPVCNLADRASSGNCRKWLVRWSSKERFSSEDPCRDLRHHRRLPACNNRREGFMRQGASEICDTMSAIISRCLQLFEILKMPSKTAPNLFVAVSRLWLFWAKSHHLDYLL